MDHADSEHVTRQARGEDIQADIFAFEADALQVIISNFVRNLKTGKESWRSAVRRRVVTRGS